MNKFGTAMILAGGKSSRMGFDKQFIKINEKRIINIIAAKLEKEFDEIIIITNKADEYKESKYRIAEDVIKGKGPLSGIHSGLSICSSKYAFVVACDMPNINIDYIKYMKSIIESNNVQGCVTKYENWIEPFSGFYSKDILVNIEKQLKSNMRSINKLLKELDIYYINEKKAREFSPTWDMFLNLNTKDDLNNYLEVTDNID